MCQSSVAVVPHHGVKRGTRGMRTRSRRSGQWFTRMLDASAGSSRASRCRAASTRARHQRSEEHTSELQSLMRISYAVFCLKKKKEENQHQKLHQPKSKN